MIKNHKFNCMNNKSIKDNNNNNNKDKKHPNHLKIKIQKIKVNNLFL